MLLASIKQIKVVSAQDTIVAACDSLPQQLSVFERLDSTALQYNKLDSVEGREVLLLAKRFLGSSLSQLDTNRLLLPTIRYIAEKISCLPQLNLMVEEYEKMLSAWEMANVLLHHGYTAERVMLTVQRLANAKRSKYITETQSQELDSLIVFFTTDNCNLRVCTYYFGQLLVDIDDAQQHPADFDSLFSSAINNVDRNDLISRVPYLKEQQKQLFEKLKVDSAGKAKCENVTVLSEEIRHLRENIDLLYNELKENRAAIESVAK